MSNQRYGVTVNLYLDGQGFDSTSVCTSCENTIDTQWKCPFAMADVMPMSDGDRCYYKDGSECHKFAAKLDALKKAAKMLEKEIANVEEQMED